MSPCLDDNHTPMCPRGCDDPCCVGRAPDYPERAPRDLDVAVLVHLLLLDANWTPAQAVAELDKLRARGLRWRRWRGPGEPAEGVRVQTPRWTAHYFPVAVIVWPPEAPFVPDPDDDPIPF